LLPFFIEKLDILLIDSKNRKKCIFERMTIFHIKKIVMNFFTVISQVYITKLIGVTAAI